MRGNLVPAVGNAAAAAREREVPAVATATDTASALSSPPAPSPPRRQGPNPQYTMGGRGRVVIAGGSVLT